jgi:GT2 family glycosyltransferase
MVTRDPGPWFDETLAALGAQNYDELSVLVVVSGGESDPTERVAAHLPGAFVSHLSEDHGFGAAVNGALPLVEGAAFFLLCHDDCAPDADAVRLMVEESFRSNAGMVTPKVVRWDDPSVLVHVGMSADRTGAVVDRVQEGEIDHGQHDAVRDVFVAPGGCTLVRADLLRELGGYDTAMVAMGEDLDLSWRAQAAGARVVVAPQARVRHLELTAAGQRALSPAAGEATTLQGLQRRNELRAMLKCSGTFNFLGRIVLALLLSAGEIVLALAVRDRERTRAVVGAWRDNLAHRRELRQLRRQVRAQRVNSDRQLRALMVPGLTRLSTYLTRLVHQGFDTAHGLVPSRSDAPTAGVESAVLTGSVGLAFSEDADFDDLDDLGRRSGRDRFGRHRRRPLMSSHRSRLAVYLATALVLVVGTRGLLGQAFPQVGQLAPLGSWSSAWHQFFAGWHTPGVGTTAPATPAFALLGVSGTALFGAMGLLQKVLVLGCIPLGAW